MYAIQTQLRFLSHCLLLKSRSVDATSHFDLSPFVHTQLFWFGRAFTAQVEGAAHPQAVSHRLLPFHCSLNRSSNVTHSACNKKMRPCSFCPHYRFVIFCCARTSIASISMVVRSSCFIETVDKEDLICFVFLSSLSLMRIREDKGILTRKKTQIGKLNAGNVSSCD